MSDTNQTVECHKCHRQTAYFINLDYSGVKKKTCLECFEKILEEMENEGDDGATTPPPSMVPSMRNPFVT